MGTGNGTQNAESTNYNGNGWVQSLPLWQVLSTDLPEQLLLRLTPIVSSQEQSSTRVRPLRSHVSSLGMERSPSPYDQGEQSQCLSKRQKEPSQWALP